MTAEANRAANHVAVFVDHREAHVFHIDTVGPAGPAEMSEQTVRAKQHMHRRHPKLSQGAAEHPDDAQRFFKEVCHALEGATQVLIVGPSTAKLDLVRYIHKNEHALEAHIVGIETVDHPTNAQLVAYAKQYFGLPVRLGVS